MRLKKISDYETGAVYALVEATDTEAGEVKAWLEEHCKGDYRMDRFHLVLKHPAEILFVLRWIDKCT